MKRNIVPAGFESDEEFDVFGNFIEKQKYFVKPQVENLHEVLTNACITNNVPEIMRVLNSGSININTYLHNKWTGLMYAAFHGSFDAIKYLLENGADPLVQYDYHNVIMCVCNCQFFSDEINLLNCLKLLANFDSIDVNSKDRDGMSALMYACSNGQLKIVEFLFNHGADIEVKDNQYGRTALFFAVWYNHINVVKFLLSRNADKHVIDKKCLTVYIIAETKKFVGILNLLNVDYDNELEVCYTDEYAYWDKVMNEVENGYNNDVQVFLKTLSMDIYINYFNSNKITFKSLLSGNTYQSVKTGISLTPHCLILATALKCFHTQNWSKYCLEVQKNKMDAEHILQLLVGIVRQLHIIDASVMYLETYNGSLNSQKGQQALIFLKNIRATESKIFEILEKKQKIGQVDYIGPHKLRYENIKINLLDKMFVASIVTLVLLNVF